MKNSQIRLEKKFYVKFVEDFSGLFASISSFPGRVLVIFHWISEGLCNSSFIEGILTSTIEKKPFHMGLFCNFINPQILERKFSQHEMSLSQKYI